MNNFPIPEDEQERLHALERLHILDTDPEERYDRITERAIKELHVPISTISLIDRNREWYKSCQGIKNHELQRDASFCTHAIMSMTPMVIEDTFLDDRFKTIRK